MIATPHFIILLILLPLLFFLQDETMINQWALTEREKKIVCWVIFWHLSHFSITKKIINSRTGTLYSKITQKMCVLKNNLKIKVLVITISTRNYSLTWPRLSDDVMFLFSHSFHYYSVHMIPHIALQIKYKKIVWSRGEKNQHCSYTMCWKYMAAENKKHTYQSWNEQILINFMMFKNSHQKKILITLDTWFGGWLNWKLLYLRSNEIMERALRTWSGK